MRQKQAQAHIIQLYRFHKQNLLRRADNRPAYEFGTPEVPFLLYQNKQEENTPSAVTIFYVERLRQHGQKGCAYRGGRSAFCCQIGLQGVTGQVYRWQIYRTPSLSPDSSGVNHCWLSIASPVWLYRFGISSGTAGEIQFITPGSAGSLTKAPRIGENQLSSSCNDILCLRLTADSGERM